jgi:hypothetical protein
MDSPSNPEHGNLGAIESNRPEIPIDDDPPALDGLAPDRQRPHCKPTPLPPNAGRLADGHGVVRRFENPDRAGQGIIPDGPFSLMWAKYLAIRFSHRCQAGGASQRLSPRRNSPTAVSIHQPATQRTATPSQVPHQRIHSIIALPSQQRRAVPRSIIAGVTRATHAGRSAERPMGST